MIRVCLVGLGRMGRAFFEQAQASSDVRVVSVIDRSADSDSPELDGVQFFSVHAPSALQSVDVIVDVSSVQGLEKSAALAVSSGLPLVSGVTGLTAEQRAVLEDSIVSASGRAVFAANFSFGMAAFLHAANLLASALPGYDIEIVEMHHRHKKDAPSGTASVLAEAVGNAAGKKGVVYGRHGSSNRGDEVGVHSVRAGDFFGDHLVIFAGPGEHIELRHSAHSRVAFAAGALDAVRFIHGVRRSGIYGMADVVVQTVKS